MDIVMNVVDTLLTKIILGYNIDISDNFLQFFDISYNFLQFLTISYNFLQFLTICYNFLQFTEHFPKIVGRKNG